MTLIDRLKGRLRHSLRWLVASPALMAVLAGCAHSPQAQTDAIQSAAAKGNAKAQYELAGRYARGKGVPQDYATAVEYLRRSADQGYVYAETDLGSYYARGLGVKQDFATALEWYRKAASRNDPLAEYCIGYAYAHGQGVTKDMERAVQWWTKSAAHGQVDAQDALGQFYFRGGHPDDTNHINYAASAKWLRKAAEQGYLNAMNNLAFLYQNGMGVKKDLPQAFKWFNEAAQRGDAMAQANLGLMYEDGSVGPSDLVQAYKWFTLSAEQGNVVGMHSFDDYNEHHRLTSEQLVKARQMVAEFHTQALRNRSAAN